MSCRVECFSLGENAVAAMTALIGDKSCALNFDVFPQVEIARVEIAQRA
jgi:hypothetical protein